MAEYTATTPKKDFDIPADKLFGYKSDYSSDWDIHKQYIQNFDPWEAMLIGMVYDTVSNSIDGSKITDSYSTTLAKERADRVMAKLPDGQTIGEGKSDIGKAMFLDILRQKWVYVNANAQHSFMEKLNMWQFYSSVYGYMPMFYDMNVSPSGYAGPDCWLWNPRNLVPQQGRSSIAEMDYVTALTWVSKSYLQDILDDIDGNEGEDGDTPENPEDSGGWDRDAVVMLIGLAEQSTNPDQQKDSKVVRQRTPQSIKKGVCLATRFEVGDEGHWITFAPDHGYLQVRDIPNPHESGLIPFVIKYSQPLFDSFYGLGDFQRSMPLQFARDGLTNFYFKGIKMNLIPPIVANANGVLKHTLDYREGGVMLETIPNSIRRLETSTAGLATYQAAQSNLTGSLLAQYGSQNAAIPGSDSLNPSQGKTPQAIDLYSDKEATRDGSERRHLEDAIQQLQNGFNVIIANVCTEEVPITLFADDIQDIINAGYPDIEELFDGKFKVNKDGTAGDVKIDPKKLKGINWRFQVEPDSTAKANQQAILAALQDFLGSVGKLQNIWKDDPTVDIHWDKIMKTYEDVSGIPNASEFITFNPDAKPPAPAPLAPSATAVTMEGGQVNESADLVKLYLGSSDPSLQQQIVQKLGFQPTQGEPPEAPEAGPEPTVTSSGHMFQDPHVAAAAEAINAHPAIASPPPPPVTPEPTVTGSGHVFNDSTIGQAAESLNNIPSPEPAQERATIGAEAK